MNPSPKIRLFIAVGAVLVAVFLGLLLKPTAHGLYKPAPAGSDTGASMQEKLTPSPPRPTAPAPVSTPSAESDTDTLFYRPVFARIDAGQWPEARRLVAQGPNPLLNKAIDWLDLIRANSGRRFAEIAAFVETNPDWPQSDLLTQRAEEAMTVATPASEVLAWFEQHRPRSTDGFIRLIEALKNTGAQENAFALIRQTWIERDFGATQERNFLSAHREQLTAHHHWRRLDRLLWQGKFHSARRMLFRVNEERRALAVARMTLRRMEYGVDKIIEEIPSALANDPGLVYERLRWRLQKGRYDDAKEWLATAPRPFPYSALWWREINILARDLFYRGRHRDAYRLAANHGQKEAGPVSQAEWFAGWLALRFLDQPARALKHFTAMYERVRYPISRARGAYWAGRAAEALGRAGAADRWYRQAAVHEETYYGQLAAGRLGRPGVRHLSEPQPSPDAIHRFEQHELVRTVRVLAKLDQAELAKPFLRQIADLNSDTTQFFLAAKLATELGRTHWAIDFAKRSSRQGVTVHNVAYPLLNEISATAGTHTALIHAIIRQESLFNPSARSRAGASGLMQLMPATARQLAADLRLVYTPNYLIRSPAYNVMLGQAYISRLLERWNDSHVLALASYNAGPGRVQSWLERFGDPRRPDVDLIDWIETIPFPETRNYVQRVLEGLTVYRGRLDLRLTARLGDPSSED